MLPLNIITTILGLIFGVAKVVGVVFPELNTGMELVEGGAVVGLGYKAVEAGNVRRTAQAEHSLIQPSSGPVVP